jgi:hypothetical protein
MKDLSFTAETAASVLADVLAGDVEEAENGWVLRSRDIELPLSADVLEAALHELESVEVDGAALIGPQSYEILVAEENDNAFRTPLWFRLSRREDSLELRDDQLGVTYVVGRPTDAYMLAVLDGLASLDRRRVQRGLFFLPGGVRGSDEELARMSALDLLRVRLRRPITIRITSERRQSPQAFAELAHALYFHLSFNLDVSLVPRRSFEALLRSRPSITRTRELRELDPPRRTYVPDLVDHYQMAVGSQSPVVQFLSYYHVMEHFFEEVFTEDLVARMRDAITQPDFSVRRSRDVRRLIKVVTSSLRARDEEVAINEEVALRLTLEKFVELDRLVGRLEDFDETIVEYLRSNGVRFCDAPTVDLGGDDREKVFQTLARRVYAVRNAVVHAKEGSRKRYRPFEHDAELRREAPLLRVLAELVIIGSGTVVE